MLGEALLVSKGIEAKDHVLPINQLIQLQIKTSRPLNLLDRLRTIRHNINYNGYKATIPETKDILSFTRENFPIIFNEALKKIESD